jgi:hypothetical protein
LSKETRDTLRQEIPVGRYEEAVEIKLPVQVLDDVANQPFILDEYQSMWENPMGVTWAR